jgi:hypothetical protein
VISEANSAEYITTLMDDKNPAPRDHWARSFQFIADGNYLLQESSVELQDGSIAEVMESVFPRSTLKPSASFQVFKMDPSDPTGGDEVKRFRFLPSETIYQGEYKLAYSQHYDIANGATIDWYATPNILGPSKSGTGPNCRRGNEKSHGDSVRHVAFARKTGKSDRRTERNPDWNFG